MAVPSSKVSAGQPFKPSARQWNRFVDASDLVLNQFGKTGLGKSVPRVTVDVAVDDVYDMYSILEVTGTTVQDPVANADLLGEFQTEPIFEAGLPNNAVDQKRPCVILLEGADEANAVVKAMLVGTAPCQVDIIDEEHRFAIPINANSDNLRSDNAGPFELIANHDNFVTTGVQWCLVRSSGGGQVPYPIIIGKTVGVMSARSGTTPGTGSVQPYKEEGGVLIADGPLDSTWQNAFSAEIPDDVWVAGEMDKHFDTWLIAADCDPTLNPLSSPIEQQTDGDTMQSGAGTVLII